MDDNHACGDVINIHCFIKWLNRNAFDLKKFSPGQKAPSFAREDPEVFLSHAFSAKAPFAPPSKKIKFFLHFC